MERGGRERRRDDVKKVGDGTRNGRRDVIVRISYKEKFFEIGYERSNEINDTMILYEGQKKER